ncbi:type VI secretion system tip protein TssI/VgrG, partial [Modicisalibacter sp. R2A 31.J]
LKTLPGSLQPRLDAAKRAHGLDDLDPQARDDARDSDYARIGTGHFLVDLEAQRRSQPYRHPLSHPRPVVGGPQTATVVGPEGEEIHTDPLDRVRVQFHWDRQGRHDERAGVWLRVAQPNAGAGWGGVFVPRIGQEVLVDFLEGDPDRPLITGRVYNGEQRPEWHSHGLFSGFKSKTYRGSQYNELLFDDATDSGGRGEAARLKAPWLHLASPAGIALSTPESTHLAQGKSLSVSSGEDINLAAGRRLVAAVADKLSLFVQKAGMKLFAARGKVEIQAQSDAMELTAKKDVKITSTEGRVEITAENGILLTSGGSYIRVENGNVDIHCPGAVDVKGAQHNFSGPTNLTRQMPDLPESRLYEEFFTLKDKQSGQPLPYARYRVETGDGKVFEGRSDGDGKTQKVFTAQPQNMRVTILDRFDDAMDGDLS